MRLTIQLTTYGYAKGYSCCLSLQQSDEGVVRCSTCFLLHAQVDLNVMTKRNKLSNQSDPLVVEPFVHDTPS